MQNPTKEEIQQILKKAKVIAVVGLSDKPDRTSYRVSQIMQQAGYKIIPVNPNADEILGEKSRQAFNGYRGTCGYCECLSSLRVFT